MTTILIADDDLDICNALKIYLSSTEYTVLEAHTGKEVLEILEDTPVDLILMDIMMPQMDGITAVASIRQKSNVPVILLTAKSEDTDKILGLDIGADDYITKPFNPSELLARVRSQLRRYMYLGGNIKSEGVLEIGGIRLDDGAKKVMLYDEEIALTPMEYGILKYLMENPGQVISSSRIYEHVWQETSLGNESTIAVHIRHLREKIEIDPSHPRYIKVVWGQGYKIEKDNTI